MDDPQFDAFTRRFHSRRIALAGLLGGLAAVLGVNTAEDSSAHNPAPACRKIKDAARRRACLRRARAHKRKAHSCKPQPVSVTCGNRCGTARNNCNKVVTCPCPAGKTCLANGGCNRTCSVSTCPAGCTCQFVLAENPVLATAQCHSGSLIIDCDQIPQPCATSAHCPPGFFCADVSESGCGTDRCVPSCPF